MHGVVAQAQEERALVAAPYQANGLVGYAVGQVLALGAVGQRLYAVGHEVALMRMAPVAAAYVYVKAHPVGVELAPAQVPLAHVPGVIAALAQGLRQRHVAPGQVVYVGRLHQARALRMEAVGRVYPVGQAQPRGIPPGEVAAARGRAYRAGRVGLAKQYAGRGQRVDVGRFVESGAHAAQIHPPHVVHEYEHYVGLFHNAQPPCRKAAFLRMNLL